MLIIQSKDDKGVSLHATNALKELYPTAEFYIFENAGHSPMYSKRDEYMNLIFTFLRDH